VQLAQPGLDELLTLERGLVLRVFPKVAQLDCLSDGLRQQDIQFMAELVDLPAQLLLHFTDHGPTRRNKEWARRRYLQARGSFLQVIMSSDAAE
jgi:hypothetical protein